jgi:hypothetical protein
MYIKIGNDFVDQDYSFLVEMLQHLDIKVREINSRISKSFDPDTDGLFDAGEHLIGLGFSLIQRYINTTYPQLNIKKDAALSLGSEIRNGLTYIKAINAGANYWKHQDEWGIFNSITEDIESQNRAAKFTIATIELITPWAEYTCSNLLAELINDKEFILSSLLPHVEEWRSELDSLSSSK